MSDGIKTHKDGGILEITIDRPKANAIDLIGSRRLNEVVTAFRDDPALRIAIVTGAGDRFFSPGWDLKAAAAGDESRPQLADGPPLLVPAIKQLLRPTQMVPEHEAFELHDSLDAVQRVIRSDDLKEGTRAFSEKSNPRWTAR